MRSPTQRTLNLLRKDGYIAQVVERWNPYAKVRQDLFGIIDVLAMHSEVTGVVGIQATSYSNISSRVQKTMQSEHIKTWLQAGNGFYVHGWKKKGSRWECHMREFSIVGNTVVVDKVE